MSIHRLENNDLSIKIDDLGAELCSIYDKEEDREVLWQADPAYWKRHAPVLFPNVGKHFGGTYLHEGKTYQTSQHGFARDMRFEVIDKTDNSITHKLEADEDTKDIFPFSFVLEVTHVLKGNEVKVEWKVFNKDRTTMYFTIGGHPAFNVPVLEGTKQTDYKLLFESKKDLEYVLLDKETGTATPEKTAMLELEDGMCQITEGMFDNDALIFDDNQVEWAAIGYPDGKPYVGLRCKEFPSFGIWSVPGAPYVCLEPWDGRCDNYGFTADISEKPGIISLPSGEVYDKEYQIIIYK